MKKNSLSILSFVLATSLLAGQQSSYLFKTKQQATYAVQENKGAAWIVSKDNFPALDGITCYSIEVWDESMRLPHWHPNASELGYVKSGTIEIILWLSPGETSVFTVSEGMCWFIPQGALHSLNNISKEKAVLLVGFSSDLPQNIDLPVAFNGIPAPVRDALTSPHEELKKWNGPVSNPLFGSYTPNAALNSITTGSPYKFDFADVTPLFSNPQMGSVVWGIKNNWNILEHISVLRATLKPKTARDTIWYPDVNTLYVVSKGAGLFYMLLEKEKVEAVNAKLGDYFFVPTGMLHTFINDTSDDFEVIAFFTKANPLPEVSLSVATSFLPESVQRQAMMEWGTQHLLGDPLKYLKYKTVSPYLLPLSND